MKTKMYVLITMKYFFIAGIICSALTSCGMTTETSSDSRFKSIIGREIQTKRQLRLYRNDPHQTGDNVHFCLTEAYYRFSETDSGEVAIIPQSHRVQFDKLRRTRSLSGGSEYLLGTLKFKGTTYPISYWLGLIGDDSNAGWKGIYRSFEMPE